MKALIYLTIFVLSEIWLSSCRTQHVPVETIKTEIKYRDRWLRDSTYVHDSIYIREKGDTIFIERWHTKYKDRLLRDTTYVEKTDSIQVPYPVERKLSWWESVKIEIGGIAVGVIIVLLLIMIWLIYKNRHK